MGGAGDDSKGTPGGSLGPVSSALGPALQRHTVDEFILQRRRLTG